MSPAEYDYAAQAARVSGHAARLQGVAAIAFEPPEQVRPEASRSAALAQTVAAAAAGDQVAFARIVAEFHTDMVRVCQVITRDADQANDAAQEAWGICWRQLPRLREPSRLRSWLVAIAANEARQIVRSQRRRVVTELRVEGPRDDDEGTTVWGGRIDLRNALAGLSVDDRQLLALRYVAGFDSAELSRITGLSPSGTRARLQRLLATLRVQLEGPNA
jgi:RNA polymerase sigma factor (sigma-70 family)